MQSDTGPPSAPLTVDEAAAVLEIDPGADADFVDLAYWRQVDLCRARLLGSPTWPARMQQLNHARTLMSAVARQHEADRAAETSPPTSEQRRSPWATVAVLGAAALVLAIVGTARAAGWDWGAIAAAAFGILALVTFATIVALTVADRRPPASPPRDENPYHVLHVQPSAEQELIATAYRHRRRTVIAAGDVTELQTLEEAYARIGTPSARAAYDLQAAATTVPEPAPVRPRRRPASTWLTRLRRLRIRETGQPRRSLPNVHREPRHEVSEAPVPSADPARAVGALRVRHDGREVRTLMLHDRSVYTIGRGPHCDVRLATDQADTDIIADEHARLNVRHGRVMFHHLASSATTLVNGEPAVWVVLEPGDTLTVGRYTCQYVDATDGQPPADPAVPE